MACKRILIGGALAAMAAATASPGAYANGWEVTALGDEPGQSACMSRAERILARYDGAYGLSEIVSGEWTVSGYAMSGSGVDTLIVCREENGRVEPYIVTHSEDARDDDRRTIHDRVRRYWNLRK